MEVVEMKARNAELEQDREELRHRIATLQTEAQMLRDCGTVSLHKENDLLRAEIRKHKKFIRTILDAVDGAPIVTEEERTRLLRDGVDAAVGQVLGIMYTSAFTGESEMRWSSGADVVMSGSRVRVRYQLLPLGSDAATAKRVNLRFDYRTDRLVDRDKMWELFRDNDFINECVGQVDPTFADGSTRLEMRDIMPETLMKQLDESDDKIRVVQYVELKKNSQSHDCLCACTQKDVDLYAAAFQHLGDVKETLFPNPDKRTVRASVFVSSSSEEIQAQAKQYEDTNSEFHRVVNPILEAFVLTRSEADGGTYWTSLLSIPADVPCFYTSSSDKFVICPDTGQLSRSLQTYVGSFLLFLKTGDPRAGAGAGAGALASAIATATATTSSS